MAVGLVPAATAAALTVFTSATVFDGVSFLSGPTDVVVADGHIVAVGPGLAALEEYASAEIVDCAGSTLLPGFFDAHVHLISSRFGNLASLARPYTAMFYESVANAAATVATGITTVRDAAGVDLGMKTAVAEGLVPGPRMRIAVSMMSQTGGHGDSLMASGLRAPTLNLAIPGRPLGVADGVEEVRKTVRTILQAGADHIKISATGGVLSPTDDPRHPQFTEPEIRVIVEEAERQGKYVLAHAMAASGIMAALRAGVRSIEHGVYLDSECIEFMIANNRYLVPTLIAPVEVLRMAENGMPLPQNIKDKAARVAEDHRKNVAIAVAAGVKVAMGTDSGVGDHGHNLDELVLLADVGMSTTAVLAATTSVAAELMDLGDQLGRITDGYIADLVIVDTPLGPDSSLVGISDRITGVWQSGRRTV